MNIQNMQAVSALNGNSSKDNSEFIKTKLETLTNIEEMAEIIQGSLYPPSLLYSNEPRGTANYFPNRCSLGSPEG
jgi:hypothetical protein